MTFNQYEQIIEVLKTPITKKSNRPTLLDYPAELRGPPTTDTGVITRIAFAALKTTRLILPVQLGNILLNRLANMSRVLERTALRRTIISTRLNKNGHLIT
jgi:hypothetical protein